MIENINNSHDLSTKDIKSYEDHCKIIVIGAGGAGCNAVNKMIKDKIEHVEFWVMNTDAQALNQSMCSNKLLLGSGEKRGRGAGGIPRMGEIAASQSLSEIKQIVKGADMVFLAAGMGGGTGTGASPIIAKAAKEAGALTVAVITKPFSFEGLSRHNNAVEGINKLKQNVDSYIVVPNDRLFLKEADQGVYGAFRKSDSVLSLAVKTIADLIQNSGVINLDFADVKSVMQNSGIALISFGSAKGEKKALKAAINAVSSPLLECSIKGAQSLIVNISGGNDLSLEDTQEAVNYIKKACGTQANIIFGLATSEEQNPEVSVGVVACHFNKKEDEAVITGEVELAPDVSPDILPEPDQKDDEDDLILPDFMSKLINSSVDLKSDEDVESDKESVQQEQNQSDDNKEDFSNSSKEEEPINKNMTEETTAEPYEESSNTLEDKSENNDSSNSNEVKVVESVDDEKLVEENKKLQDDLSKKNEEINKQREDKSHLEDVVFSLKQENEQIPQLKDKIESLEKELAKIDELEKKLDEKDKALSQLEQSKDVIEESRKNEADKLDDLIKIKDELEAQVPALKSKLDDSNKENEYLTLLSTSLKNANINLSKEGQKDRLSSIKELQRMSFVNHLLSDQLKELLIEADQKQSTLNYLEKKNRNLVLEKRRNERLYSNRISNLMMICPT